MKRIESLALHDYPNVTRLLFQILESYAFHVETPA